MNSQQNSEKNPLDELFARKLGKLEQSPAPDSFARLQQRMQGGQEKPRLVLWRNYNAQMAAAACVAIALLMGWLYTSNQSGGTIRSGRTVAVHERQAETQRNNGDKATIETTVANQVPQVARVRSVPAPKRSQAEQQVRLTTAVGTTSAADEQAVAQQPATNQKETPMISAGQKLTTEAIAAAKTAPAPQATPKERVLIVTIEEPEALVAARQTAASVVNNMPVLAASPTKEGKATFWQQVKRLKQDDDVARQDGVTDESGLLSRAYKGIKHRLEKDKQTKQ